MVTYHVVAFEDVTYMIPALCLGTEVLRQKSLTQVNASTKIFAIYIRYSTLVEPKYIWPIVSSAVQSDLFCEASPQSVA